jgi:DNA polymerase-3 subunit delta'
LKISDIIGQDKIKDILKNSIINNKVSHAYIFSGEKGIGKKTFAKIFADVLLCNNNERGERCNTCNICKMLDGKTSPDFISIDHKNTTIGIDEIRNIKSHANIVPMYSSRKIYIIEDAERITPQGQNSLLKLFEEPPEYTTIILTTSKYDSLLETIRSRAVKMSFSRNSHLEVKQYIQKTYENLENKSFIISYANGVIGKAKEIIEDDDFLQNRNELVNILSGIIDKRNFNLAKTSVFFEENKEVFPSLMDILEGFLRDMLILKYESNEKMLINFDKKDIMLRSNGKVTVENIINCIEVIENTKEYIKTNTNFSLAVDVLIIKLREELSND